MILHDFYAILNIVADASDADVRRAYHARVRQYHPDLHPHLAMANELLQQVNAAGEVLCNPERRRAYDQMRVMHHQGKPFIAFDATSERGYDVEYTVRITPIEAQLGTQRSLQFHDQRGNPVIVAITIPVGIFAGSIQRYIGRGGPNRAGTQYGDLFVRIAIQAM